MMARRPMTIVLLASMVALTEAPTGAQAPPVGDGAARMVRAAGMPLNDGALAPGTLTVRVVQGAFTGNLAGLTVTIDIDGQAPKSAATGADGRAEFAHLPIGARVHASAVVGDERLESERFAMPAESGVRLLLVTGDEFVDTATAPAVSPGAAPATEAPPPVVARSDAGATPDDGTAGITAFRTLVVTATFLAFVVVGWRGLSRGRGTRVRDERT